MMLALLVLASVSAASPDDSPATVLVLDPVGAAANEDQRRVLASSLGRALAQLAGPRVQVLTANDVRGMLSAEAQRQESGCDDAACAAELAGALGSTRVVVSHIARVDGEVTLSTELLDVRTARVLARGESAARSIGELKQRIDQAVHPIAAVLRPPPSLATVAWPAACVAAGLTVLAGGVAWDVLAPSSRDGRLNLPDAVGPVAYVSAAGLAVAALFNPLEPGAATEGE